MTTDIKDLIIEKLEKINQILNINSLHVPFDDDERFEYNKLNKELASLKAQIPDTTITPNYDFQKYKRKQIAELRPVTENDIDLFKAGDTIPASFQFNVSISDADRKNGSPKIGDMIARNPKNHSDQWLVAKQYFEDNFERASIASDTEQILSDFATKISQRDIDPEIAEKLTPEFFKELMEASNTPASDTDYLNACIEKATPNLSKIQDVDKELDEIRGEYENDEPVNILTDFAEWYYKKSHGYSIRDVDIDEYLKSKQ